MCKLLLGLSLPLCNGFHWRSCFQSRQLLLKQPRSCRQVVDSDAPSIDHKVDVDNHLHLHPEWLLNCCVPIQAEQDSYIAFTDSPA